VQAINALVLVFRVGAPVYPVDLVSPQAKKESCFSSVQNSDTNRVPTGANDARQPPVSAQLLNQTIRKQSLDRSVAIVDYHALLKFEYQLLRVS